jgi:hypothetical protein
MGWTVLYIAFGIVALWLLGEVLLQYKARLRWRVLAFVGFLCVVAGALIPSVLVIGVGIAAFATGQTFVTLSYRRGFVAGWALTGVPGVGGRRDEEPEPEPAPEAEQAPGFEPLDAPEPVPALAAAGGGFGGPEQGALGQGGFDQGGFETAAMPALDSMSAPPGFANGQNRYDNTEAFASVDTMRAPDGFGGDFGTDGGGYNPNNGNRYDNPGGANRYDNPNGNGYDAVAFAGGDAFGGGMNGGMNGGGMNGAPNGFDGTQTFSNPFAPEQDSYQTGSYPGAGAYGADQGGQQIPVYQPGPLPEEMTTGDFPIPPGAYDGFGGYQGGGQSGMYQDPNQAYAQNGQFADPYAGFDANQAPQYDSYGNGFDNFGGGYADAGQSGYGPQASPYGVSDTFGGGGGFGAGGQGADAYGSMYGNGESYADGQSYFPQGQDNGAAWVPQQRDPNEQMLPPEQQAYGYQNDPYGYGTQGGNGYGYY